MENHLVNSLNNEKIKFIIGNEEFIVKKSLFTQVIELYPSFLNRLINNSHFQRKDYYRFPDRDPNVFKKIIEYYESGYFPNDEYGNFSNEIDSQLLKRELDFWQIRFERHLDCKKMVENFNECAIETLDHILNLYLQKLKEPDLFVVLVFDAENPTKIKLECNKELIISSNFIRNLYELTEAIHFPYSHPHIDTSILKRIQKKLNCRLTIEETFLSSSISHRWPFENQNPNSKTLFVLRFIFGPIERKIDDNKCNLM